MKNPDRLYDLLPAVYRMRDADEGYPLQELLRVVTEQVEIWSRPTSRSSTKTGSSRRAKNGWCPISATWSATRCSTTPANRRGNSPRAHQREHILISRRDVANTIHDRRRKGTSHLMQSSRKMWPAGPRAAVEFFQRWAGRKTLHTPLLNQSALSSRSHRETLGAIAISHQLTEATLLWLNPTISGHIAAHRRHKLCCSVGGRRADSPSTSRLDRLEYLRRPVRSDCAHGGRPPDQFAPAVGRHNIPSAGVFVWRLQTISVGLADATDAGGNPRRRASHPLIVTRKKARIASPSAFSAMTLRCSTGRKPISPTRL